MSLVSAPLVGSKGEVFSFAYFLLSLDLLEGTRTRVLQDEDKVVTVAVADSCVVLVQEARRGQACDACSSTGSFCILFEWRVGLVIV